MSLVRRATTGGRRPQFPFVIEEEQGRRVRLALAAEPERDDDGKPTPTQAQTSLEQKIIDYLRQTAEWDHRASPEAPRGDERARPDRLLPFEYRARRQYRDSAQRPRRPKR